MPDSVVLPGIENRVKPIYSKDGKTIVLPRIGYMIGTNCELYDVKLESTSALDKKLSPADILKIITQFYATTNGSLAQLTANVKSASHGANTLGEDDHKEVVERILKPLGIVEETDEEIDSDAQSVTSAGSMFEEEDDDTSSIGSWNYPAPGAPITGSVETREACSNARWPSRGTSSTRIDLNTGLNAPVSSQETLPASDANSSNYFAAGTLSRRVLNSGSIAVNAGWPSRGSFSTVDSSSEQLEPTNNSSNVPGLPLEAPALSTVPRDVASSNRGSLDLWRQGQANIKPVSKKPEDNARFPSQEASGKTIVKNDTSDNVSQYSDLSANDCPVNAPSTSFSGWWSSKKIDAKPQHTRVSDYMKRNVHDLVAIQFAIEKWDEDGDDKAFLEYLEKMHVDFEKIKEFEVAVQENRLREKINAHRRPSYFGK